MEMVTLLQGLVTREYLLKWPHYYRVSDQGIPIEMATLLQGLVI